MKIIINPKKHTLLIINGGFPVGISFYQNYFSILISLGIIAIKKNCLIVSKKRNILEFAEDIKNLLLNHFLKVEIEEEL